MPASRCTPRLYTARTITISPSLASRPWRARSRSRWRSIRAPRARCRPPRARSAGELSASGFRLRGALPAPRNDRRELRVNDAHLHRPSAAGAQGRNGKRSGTLRVRARRIPFLGLRAGAALAAALPAVAGVRDLSGGQHHSRHRLAADRRGIDGAIPCRVAGGIADRFRGGDLAALEAEAPRLEDARL